MDQSTMDLLNRIKSREFSLRRQAAEAIGRPPSYITSLGKFVIEEGIVDRRQWDACFSTTPGQGKRGKDRRPRRKPEEKVLSGQPQPDCNGQPHPASMF